MSSIVKSRLIRVTEKYLGSLGKQFVIHQCNRLNIDLDNMGPADMELLVDEMIQSAVLVIGKLRADKMKTDIMDMYDSIYSE